MMRAKLLLSIVLSFLAVAGLGQKRKKYVPPSASLKTHSFVLQEMQIIDSLFFEEIDSILFNKRCDFKDSEEFKLWRNFHVSFEKQDSLTYSIYIELWDLPLKKATGYLEHNNYSYFFVGDIPPKALSILQSKRRFSYQEYFPYTVVPPSWLFIYDSQGGSMAVERMNCY